MKKLNTETTTTGIAGATVYDYKSGVSLGRVTADWTQYRAWAEGPSDVCEARRCLSPVEIEHLGIQDDSVIFLLD